MLPWYSYSSMPLIFSSYSSRSNTQPQPHARLARAMVARCLWLQLSVTPWLLLTTRSNLWLYMAPSPIPTVPHLTLSYLQHPHTPSPVPTTMHLPPVACNPISYIFLQPHTYPPAIHSSSTPLSPIPIAMHLTPATQQPTIPTTVHLPPAAQQLYTLSPNPAAIHLPPATCNPIPPFHHYRHLLDPSYTQQPHTCISYPYNHTPDTPATHNSPISPSVTRAKRLLPSFSFPPIVQQPHNTATAHSSPALRVPAVPTLCPPQLCHPVTLGLPGARPGPSASLNPSAIVLIGADVPGNVPGRGAPTHMALPRVAWVSPCLAPSCLRRGIKVTLLCIYSDKL